MDYLIIGGGMFAVVVAGWALWQAINRYQKKMERERKQELQRQRRAKTAAAKKAVPATNEGKSVGLANFGGLSSGLNGTDKSLYGRSES